VPRRSRATCRRTSAGGARRLPQRQVPDPGRHGHRGAGHRCLLHLPCRQLRHPRHGGRPIRTAIGRTGRAAKTGDAFTFVTREDEPLVKSIERVLGERIERRTLRIRLQKAAPHRDTEVRPAAARNPAPPDDGTAGTGEGPCGSFQPAEGPPCRSGSEGPSRRSGTVREQRHVRRSAPAEAGSHPHAGASRGPGSHRPGRRPVRTRAAGTGPAPAGRNSPDRRLSLSAYLDRKALAGNLPGPFRFFPSLPSRPVVQWSCTPASRRCGHGRG